MTGRVRNRARRSRRRAPCTISVVFTPASSGARTASLVASATPGRHRFGVAHRRTGLAPARPLTKSAPTSYAFPTPVVVGSAAASKTFTVTAGTTGGVTSARDHDRPHLLVPRLQSTELTLGTDGCPQQTLAASATCDVTVNFAPATYGAKSATLTLNGGAPSAAITGTGEDSVALTVAKTGPGTGTVADATSAINCGGTCNAAFPRTTTVPVVTLTATPAAGSIFAGWSGGGCTRNEHEAAR